MRGRKPSWIILSLGFGGLLLFLLAAASGTLIVLDRARAGETRMRRAFLERLRALDQIRGQIYLSGTYVRDFLLSPDLSSADSQSARISALEQETHRALDAYSRSLELEERQPFSVLRSEIDGYWRVLDRTISWSPEQRSRLRYAFFYNELMPRRTAMLQIADRIAQVNEQGLNRAEEALAASSGSLRRSLLVTFGIVLAGGLLLAVMTIGYTVHLEKELQHRFAENTRSKTDLEDLSNRLLRAQEDERRTLARELHDQVGQSLSAILMEAGNAECAEQGGEQSVHLNSIRRLAEHTASEVRDLALLLRPSMLDDFGLVPALNWYSREMAKRTGLKIVLSADESANQLPGEHTTCIYRVVQEGVNNAARHAQARTIEVVVARNAHRVAFSVQDDGAGFDSHMVRGLGLLGMEERVRRLGGVLRLDSQPGRGTRISAELPVIELAHRNGNAHSHTAG
ncbi:MAG: MCP four helix bundle domain-containing protein [Acidobacteriia bacterium]|nr:MCP four helix bundle domain-containing protein [Terriglobia bacterium]